MSDLISRQSAIDAVKCGALSAAMVYGRTDEGSTALYETVKAIKALPSAHPEIVRCKDCKYWMPHSQLGYDEDNETYHDYCEKLIPDDEYYAFYRDADDFCSRAERKENQ